MIKNIQRSTSSVSQKQIADYIISKSAAEKKKIEHRKSLMRKQLSKVTGDKHIVISNMPKN